MAVLRNDADHADLKKIGRRLREARLAAKLTQTQVGERVGNSKQLISHWEKGIHRMDVIQLRDVANAVGTTTDYLVYGIINTSRSQAITDRLMPRARLVPKVTHDEMIAIASGHLSYDSIQDVRATYVVCSEQTMMFEQRDRSMEPSFPKGTIVTVDRQRLPEPGDCVLVALLATNETLYRRYRPSPGSKPGEPPYTLRAENEDFEARTITKAQKPIFLGTKIEHARIGPR